MAERLTRVLLVEDNPGDARLLRETLREAADGRFELTHVETLADAIARLATGDFEAVLLDLSLPDSQGLQTVERTHAAAPALPIIVLTGREDEALGVEAVRKGAEDYLAKGQVDPRGLRRAIRYAMERKRLLQELSTERATLQAIIDSAPEGIVVTDRQGRVLLTNPAADGLYSRSLPRAGVFGEDPEVRTLHPDGVPYRPWELPLARSAVHGESYHNVEMVMVWPDGQRRDLLVNTAPIRDAQGAGSGAIGVFQDITALKDVERKLETRVRQRTADLTRTVDALQSEVAARTEAERALRDSEEQLRQKTYDLNGRVKELHCLYAISNLMQQPVSSAQDLFQGIVRLIPGGWQHAAITGARLLVGGASYQTDNFQPTLWMLARNILVFGEKAGRVEVAYLEERPPGDEGPFLKEEVALLGALANEVGRYLERKEAELRVVSTNVLLELFARRTSRREYLDGVVELIRNWSDCACVGVRVADANRQVPYDSYTGFSEEFWQRENGLSLDMDHCACTRIIKGAPEVQDAPLITPRGSFLCLNLGKFVSELPLHQQNCYRGECVRSGFSTVAIVPLRYRDQVIGAIHLADPREAKISLKVVEFLETMAPLIGEAIQRFNVEAELHRTNDLLELMFSNIHVLVAYLDQDFNFIRVNRAYAQADGRPPEFYVGQNHFDLFPHRENEQIFRRVVETGTPYLVFGKPFEYAEHPERGISYWDWSLQPIKDLDGRVTALVLSLLNVTDRKKAEEALRQSEERYRRLVEMSPDGIGLEKDGQVVFINAAGAQLLGGTCADDFIGLPVFNFVHPDSRDRVRKQLLYLHRKGKGLPLAEERFLRLDGTTVDVEVAALVLTGQEKTVTQIVFRDISERKRAEDKVLNYQKQLQSLASELVLSEERQRRYIAEGLHDHIGQLLAAARMKLRSLEGMDSLDKINHSLGDVRDFIDQAIKYTRSLTFELSPPVLYTLGFESALEWLAEQTFEQYGIRCVFETDQKPKPMPESFKVLLFQAVRELLNNIVKHAAARQARIAVSRVDDSIRILIEDDGVGFDPAEVDVTGVRPRGYGLFSVRERLRYVGGSLEIHAHHTRGTRVILTAPLQEE